MEWLPVSPSCHRLRREGVRAGVYSNLGCPSREVSSLNSKKYDLDAVAAVATLELPGRSRPHINSKRAIVSTTHRRAGHALRSYPLTAPYRHGGFW